MKQANWARRGLIFLFITLGSMSLILYFTVDSRTVEALKSFKIEYLFILIGLCFVAYTFDALSYFLLTRATGERISIPSAYRTSAFKTFFNMITPFSFGGQAFALYYLSHEKIPAGKSSSIILTKLMLNAACVLAGAIMAFFTYHHLIMAQKATFIAFLVGGFLQILFVLSIVLIMLSPHIFIGVLIRIGNLLHRFRILRKVDRLKKFIILEAATARRSFRRYFRSHFITFTAAVISQVIYYFTILTMLYFVLSSLGNQLPFGETITFTALLIFLMGFLPTPGGAGLGEGLFVLVISKSVPVAILGIAVILWRLFVHYLSAGAGMFFTFRHFANIVIGKNHKIHEAPPEKKLE
jgi:uncharacterized protein (TIRG00374 family)